MWSWACLGVVLHGKCRNVQELDTFGRSVVEIHMGETHTTREGGRHLPAGYYLNHHCFGTYMHGILDNPVVVDHLLKPFAETVRERTRFDYAAYKEEQYALLAAATRRYTDMDTLYSILRGNTPTII